MTLDEQRALTWEQIQVMPIEMLQALRAKLRMEHRKDGAAAVSVPTLRALGVAIRIKRARE